MPPSPALSSSRLDRIAAIVFDCDGVLVDSRDSVDRAWRRWAAERALNPEQVVASAHGRPARDTVAAWVPPAEVGAELTRIDSYELLDAASVVAILGAAELVAAIPPDRWAIVTSANRALATARLRAARLPLPRILVTADDVVLGKPAPDGYRTAFRRLQIDASTVAVFEDQPTGILSARDAGAGLVVRVGPVVAHAGEDMAVPDLRAVRWNGRLRILG